MKQPKNVTIDDVAKAAGVSKSTVSQYLNKRYEYMSERTRKKIEQVIKELQFQPNHHARNLKSRKTKMIGIIVANIQHAFSTAIIRIIEQAMEERGIHVIICNADDNTEKEATYLNLLSARNVDGLIVFPTGDNYEEYKRLLENQIPVVFMDRKIEGVLADTVLLDNEAAAFLAVSTLVKTGRKTIAMLTLPLTHSVSPRVERITGYKNALQFYNIEYRDELLICAPLRDLKTKLAELFNSDHKPDGIVAGNDLVLKEALSFLKENEISIPGDVAIIGIDDVSYADIYHPSLTTIAQPVEEMGSKAAEILLERIEGKSDSVPVVYRFSPKLIMRQSC